MLPETLSTIKPRGRAFVRRAPFTSLFLVLGICLPALAGAQGGSLTLRINDMEAEQGGLVAIVVRTYASRPITQGQLCLRAVARRSANGPDRGVGTSPFISIDDWTVFSSQGDATGAVGLVGGSQIDIDFSSLTSSINDADGPLLVIYARLDPSIVADTELEISLDGLGTEIFETVGGMVQPISTRLRSGTLSVVSQGAPLDLVPGAEDSLPGSVARLAVVSQRILPWTSGYLEFSYPVSIAAGLPSVTVDPRYGNASLIVLHPSPGVVAIDFQSADQSLNYLPGEILQINLPLLEGAVPGTYQVSIEPTTAEIRDSTGQPLVLAIDNTEGLFEVQDALLFADGFETGDWSNWAP